MSPPDARSQISSLLLPILVAIGMIVYFIALFNLTILPGIIPMAYRNFIMPIVFAFPWVLFTLIFRDRTINAWNSMKTKASIIPLRWRLFYGFNTLIILSFFLFPFISPLLAIFACLILAWRVVFHTDALWEKGPTARLGYTIILFIAFAIIPTYLLVIWFQTYLSHIAAQIFLTWTAWFPSIYFLSICIVNALTIGSLFQISYGTIDRQGKPRTEKGAVIWAIYFLEVIIFSILLFIYFDPIGVGFRNFDPLGIASGSGLITYINYACLALFVMVFVAKYCVGIHGEARLSVLGVLLAAAFLVVELFNTFNIVLKEILIIGSSLIFVIAFLFSFFTAPDKLVIQEVELEAKETEEYPESQNMVESDLESFSPEESTT